MKKLVVQSYVDVRLLADLDMFFHSRKDGMTPRFSRLVDTSLRLLHSILRGNGEILEPHQSHDEAITYLSNRGYSLHQLQSDKKSDVEELAERLVYEPTTVPELCARFPGARQRILEEFQEYMALPEVQATPPYAMEEAVRNWVRQQAWKLKEVV